MHLASGNLAYSLFLTLNKQYGFIRLMNALALNDKRTVQKSLKRTKNHEQLN